MSKELKEIRRMISLQIENINKYLEIIKKEQNINSGVKNTTIVIVKKKEKKKDLTADLSWWKKELSNLKMGRLRFLSMREKKKQEKEKSSECQRSVKAIRDNTDMLNVSRVRKIDRKNI